MTLNDSFEPLKSNVPECLSISLATFDEIPLPNYETEVGVEEMTAVHGHMSIDSEMQGLVEHIYREAALRANAPLFQPNIDFSKIETLDLTGSEEPSSTATSETLRASSPAKSSSGGNDSDVEIVQPGSLSKKPTLAQQLADPDFIRIPQVLGSAAYANPWLIDSFVATPALQDVLEAGVHPAPVAWASFLKNNVLHLDGGSACSILQTWFDGTDPARYKHIGKLVFDDFLAHDRVRGHCVTGANPSVYAPFRLLAKCPNVSALVLRFDIASLPGMHDGYYKRLELPSMEAGFEERYRMDELFTATAETLQSIDFTIRIESRWAATLTEAKVRQWMQDILRYFRVKAAQAGRKGIEFSMKYEVYRGRREY